MKRSIILTIIVLFLLVFSSCKENEPVNTAENLINNTQFNENVDLSVALSEDKVKAATDFSLLLFKQYTGANEVNPVISPVSAYFALAMTSNGADGDTLDEFKELLCGHLSLSDINNLCSGLIVSLQDTKGHTKLNIANSVWIRNYNFEVNKNFADLVGRHYGADMYAVDFLKDETLDNVNDWINQKTEGMIPTMLDYIDQDAVMLLINTLYLNARWKEEFAPNYGYSANFTAKGGEKVMVEYLASSRNAQYITNDTSEGVVLPYDDGRLVFAALKPREGKGIEEITDIFNEEFLTSINSIEKKSMMLVMPKFEIEYETLMNDILIDMGLIKAFSAEKADLTKLGKSSVGNIYINRVIQKVKIKVNEKGTEAAAATVVEADDESDEITDIILRFDSPFIYAIIDTKTGIPLFLGRLDNPKK